jgi:hypothetical protein
MKKWAHELNRKFQRKRKTWPIKDEETFNFSGYKRDANQNYTEISPHSSQNGMFEGQKKTMLARIW